MRTRSIWLLLGLLIGVGYPKVGAQPAAPDALRADLAVARKKVYPALVNIAVVFRYFVEGRSQRSPAGGSGVIISPDGYVLTNYHVAGNTTRILCTLTTGETLEAQVVTHDPLTDLSVLKLRLDKRADPKVPIPYATLGDSDKVEIGEVVLSMGNPMMLASSMTMGVVSNRARVFTDFTGTQIEDQELEEGEKTGIFTRWIQHDALIQPGNSGGPLVNLKGEVIGINELGGGGIGFAIPSNLAAQVYKEAREHGEVRRGWLGLTILPVSKLGRTTGALISSVSPNSPAAKGGLQPGDLLSELDGQAVQVRFFEEVPLLYQRIAQMPAGKVIAVKVLRAEKPVTATLTVASMQKYQEPEEEFRNVGITARPITQAVALALRLPNREGVLVTGVRSGFPAGMAQPPLQEDDVIRAVDGKPIPDMETLRRLFASPAAQRVLTFWREGERLLTVVKEEERSNQDEGTELPRAWLGIKTQVLTSELATALKMTGRKGFLITQVYPETQAEKAGLKVGDLLTALNGSPLDASRPQDAQDLRQAVENLTVGEKVPLQLLREGKPLTLTVTLEATPASGSQAKTARQKEFEFAVRDIKAMDRIERRWPKDQKGVLVTETTQGGWANIAGLRGDDLLLTVNGRKVTDVETFKAAMEEILKERPHYILLFVRRTAQTHFVILEPDWAKLAATP